MRYTLKRLLKKGVRTIIVETSTLFGYYALSELIRQRSKHHFSLLSIHLKENRCCWMHTSEKLVRERVMRNIHNLMCCDNIISPIGKDDWLNLLGDHICLAIMEKPYCIRNMKVLPLEEFNQWGPPLTEKLAQEILRSMRRKDEKEAAEC